MMPPYCMETASGVLACPRKRRQASRKINQYELVYAVLFFEQSNMSSKIVTAV